MNSVLDELDPVEKDVHCVMVRVGGEVIALIEGVMEW